MPQEVFSRSVLSDARFWMMVVGAVLLGFASRSYGLIEQPLTNDELIDLQIARLSWSEVAMMPDGFPPLHSAILKVGLLVTNNDLVGRWIALLYGLVSIVLTALLGRLIAGNLVGGMAAVLLALSPMHTFFTQEGRAYGLFFLVTVLAVWLFFRAVEKNTQAAWLTFVAGASSGGYVHYYFCFVLLGLGVYWLGTAWRSGSWLLGFKAFLLLAVTQLPLLVIVGYDIANQQSMRQAGFKWAALPFTGWTLLNGFCLGPSLRELHSMDMRTAVSLLLPWAVPTMLLVLALAYGFFQSKMPYRFVLLWLFLLPILGTLSLAAAFRLSDYNVRYIIPSLLPLIILIAISLCSLKNRSLAVATGGLLLFLNGVSLVNRQFDDRYRNEDARSACEYIAAHGSDEEPVYAMSHYMTVAADYYLPGGYQEFPIEDVTHEPETLQEAEALLNEREGTFWIFYSRGFHGDHEGILKQALLESPLVEHMGSWAGAEVYRGESPVNLTSAQQLQQ